MGSKTVLSGQVWQVKVPKSKKEEVGQPLQIDPSKNGVSIGHVSSPAVGAGMVPIKLGA